MSIATLRIKVFSFTALLLLSACAQPPLSSSKAKYQVNATKTLKGYASNVSKNLKGFQNNQSARHAFGDTSMDPNAAPYQGYLLKQHVAQEAADCAALVDTLPENCENLDYLAGTLTRCLNRIITDQNPMMSYSYRQLDPQGQGYYGYLLNWRRPTTLDSFSVTDFNILSQYAGQGYTNQNWQ